MATVGLWALDDRFVAVADGDDASGAPFVIERTDEGRYALLDHFDRTLGLDWKLVLSDDLARADSICALARERCVPRCIAPRELVDDLRHAAALSRPRQIARMLARLPSRPALYSLLLYHVHLGGRPRPPIE
jgi:hypothetical protein